MYQRDSMNASDMEFELSLSEITGIVEARAVADDANTPWQAVGEASGSRFVGTLKKLSVGQYRLEFRIRSGEALALCHVDPVFVGDLWILAGQSNMQGCGKMIDLEPSETGISCFYLNDTWGLAEEPLAWMNESVDPAHWTVPEEELREAALRERKTRVQGTGLGIPFAKEIRKHNNIPIGLVLCARGGTSMKQWDPAFAAIGGKSLYGALLRKVNKLGGKAAGILWYQGESETTADPGPIYFERTKAWIEQLRRDLNDPGFPFIYAQLSLVFVIPGDARRPEPKWWNKIQQAQFALEQEWERLAMVPTIDATMSDMIHLDTQSLRRVGQRMAWQALRLAYGRKVSEIGPRPERLIWNRDRTELVVQLSGINGQLRDVKRVYGFKVEKNNETYSFEAVIAEDRRSVRLQFGQSAPEQCELWHGFGFNPVVNVVDDKNIPLCVFGPIVI